MLSCVVHLRHWSLVVVVCGLTTECQVQPYYEEIIGQEITLGCNAQHFHPEGKEITCPSWSLSAVTFVTLFVGLSSVRK
jgi:hypothetical protein